MEAGACSKCYPHVNLLKLYYSATDKMTTSVLTVRITILLNPCFTASAACNIIRVSASSWLQGARLETSTREGLQITSSPKVEMTYFSPPRVIASSARNRKAPFCFHRHAGNYSSPVEADW